MKKEKIQKLTLIATPLLLSYILSFGKVFGSKVDWLSQHLLIADYIRHVQTYAANLQGGTSIYSFSYYGLFRPDILLSRLFLKVDIQYFVVSYVLFLWILTGLLCDRWLKNKGYERNLSFFLSMLCILSNVFFHAHQQVLFVEVLPFLFLAFLLIDVKKKEFLFLCVAMVLFHNYFYAPGFILIVCLYNYDQNHTIKEILLPMLIGIGIACILWLPTGLLILNNHRSTEAIHLFDLFIPQFSLKSFLYNPYGCGLTALCWIGLFQGLRIPKIKKLSFLLLLFFIFPFFSYLLNGTLYARSKILIISLPLILFVVAEWLSQKRIYKINLLLSFLFLINPFKILDFLCALFCLYLYFYQSRKVLFVYLMVPLFAFISVNSSSFLTKQTFDQVLSKDKEILLKRNQLSSRTADLDHIYMNSNHVYNQNVFKASSYTSTSNSLYNTWFYDVVKNPISQTNRTVLADSENYLYLILMSVKNVIVKKDNLYGYQQVDQQGRYKLLKNENVFPIAYVTSELIGEKQFDQLSYPYTLDTLYHRTIIQGNYKNTYQSKMTLVKKVNETIKIKSKKKQMKQYDLDFNTDHQLLCIDFDVKNKGDKKVWISINGMKNTLSKKNSVYPNKNNHFTYVLTKKQLKTLKIQCSKGRYQISNIKIYTCDLNDFSRQVQGVRLQKTKAVLAGQVNCTSGYLVTSIPYEKGYELYIDGKKQSIEVVNKAFIGCKIAKGKHKILLEFKAPGQEIAIVISVISLLLGGYEIWKNSRN